MVFKNKQNFQSVSWCCNLFLALLCAGLFAFDIYFSIALSSPHMTSHHYGHHTVLYVMHQYWTQISPGTWFCYVWAVLYGILIIWFIYVFYLLMCRQSCSRNKNPSLFSGFFWFLFIIVNALNPVWLYLLVRQKILISGIVLLVKIIVLDVLNLAALQTCSTMMQMSNQNSNDSNRNDCNSNDGNPNNYNSNDGNSNDGFMPCEAGLLNFLTLNGLPLYVMVAKLTACFQWAIIFKYFIFHWSDNMSTVVSLGIFTFTLLILWMLDLLFLRKFTVWTWLPSIALVIVLGGVVMHHNSIGGRHAPGLFFAFLLTVVSFIFLLVKGCTLSLCYPKSANPRFSRI